MIDLNTVALEIRDIINDYNQKNSILFIEDTHEYFIKNKKVDFSVSSVLKAFYNPFDSHSTKAFKDCLNDPTMEGKLLLSWEKKGDISTNSGSRTHYYLEKYLIDLYGGFKEVRQPIFECDEASTIKSDKLIASGKKYIDLMFSRGGVLLDTEMILVNEDLGYCGQPDKVWLFEKDGKIGFIKSDWKTNSKKNFEVQSWTKSILPPFQSLPDTALSHYMLQLPLYAKLLKEILKGTKYEDISYFGSVIVRLSAEVNDEEFTEYRVPNSVNKTVFELDVAKTLVSRKELLQKHKDFIKRDNKLKNLVRNEK